MLINIQQQTDNHSSDAMNIGFIDKDKYEANWKSQMDWLDTFFQNAHRFRPFETTGVLRLDWNAKSTRLEQTRNQFNVQLYEHSFSISLTLG